MVDFIVLFRDARGIPCPGELCDAGVGELFGVFRAYAGELFGVRHPVDEKPPARGEASVQDIRDLRRDTIKSVGNRHALDADGMVRRRRETLAQIRFDRVSQVHHATTSGRFVPLYNLRVGRKKSCPDPRVSSGQDHRLPLAVLRHMYIHGRLNEPLAIFDGSVINRIGTLTIPALREFAESVKLAKNGCTVRFC